MYKQFLNYKFKNVMKIHNQIRFIFLKFKMEKMDEQYNPSQDEDFEILAYDDNQSQQQRFFDNVIGCLQQIVISSEFQRKIQVFMKNNWQKCGQASKSQAEVFGVYSSTFAEYLSKDRRNQIDQQILDTLDSMREINCFKSFIKDYKTSHDQIETFKILTIKSNKIPQNKQVKGKDNIFGSSTSNNPLFDVKMKKPQSKQQENFVNKTENELMVPDMVLTVKGIRKGC